MRSHHCSDPTANDDYVELKTWTGNIFSFTGYFISVSLDEQEVTPIEVA